MNEGDKVFARDSAVLYECIERARRALLDDPDERKQGLMLNCPKPKVCVERLEESVKNGLSLRLAKDWYYRIEMSAKLQLHKYIKTRRSSDFKLAQVRAKYRGEESLIMSEEQIEREASRELGDLWSAAVEHRSVM